MKTVTMRSGMMFLMISLLLVGTNALAQRTLDLNAVDADGVVEPLDAVTRASVIEQLKMVHLDPTNVDACATTGLLASIVDAEGRYFAFCKGGTILQGSVADVEPVDFGQSEEDALSTYLKVAPLNAPVPVFMVDESNAHLVSEREFSEGPVIASAEAASQLTFAPVIGTHATCASISSTCNTVQAWADEYSGSWEWSKTWCVQSPVTWSQRTASSQLGGNTGYGPQGNQYVRACNGQSTTFKGLHLNPCSHHWDTSFNWKTGLGGFLHMKLGRRFHSSCDDYDLDLQFTTSGGQHVYTGGYRTYIVP